MKYDPRFPVAVFLGPSLDRSTACGVLEANYYPPVRMGDVYRLIGSGVRLVVVIDGFFHEVTPVWPRELAAALASGIAVIGASSMGALRAAELAPLGMMGVGTIYGWYRDGVLDGDDEVALKHGDEGHGYPAFSEPLVNLRHNLARAVARGLLDERECLEILAHLKSLTFGRRDLAACLDTPAARRLDDERRGALTAFLRDEREDLKRTDALEALRVARRLMDDDVPRPATARPRPDTTFGNHEALRRGFRRGDGALVAGEALFATLGRDPDRVAGLWRSTTARFLLLQWARTTGRAVSAERRDEYRRLWLRSVVRVDVGDDDALVAWLATIGLTGDELEEEIEARATATWLTETDPESLGVPFASHRRAIDFLLQRPGASVDRGTLLKQAAQSAYVADWARLSGIECPRDVVDAFLARWEEDQGVLSRAELLRGTDLTESNYLSLWSERALYHWLLEKGPGHFGFVTYSFARAALREMQMDGSIVALVERTNEEAP
jgi:hypothetical protein